MAPNCNANHTTIKPGSIKPPFGCHPLGGKVTVGDLMEIQCDWRCKDIKRGLTYNPRNDFFDRFDAFFCVIVRHLVLSMIPDVLYYFGAFHLQDQIHLYVEVSSDLLWIIEVVNYGLVIGLEGRC